MFGVHVELRENNNIFVQVSFNDTYKAEIEEKLMRYCDAKHIIPLKLVVENRQGHMAFYFNPKGIHDHFAYLLALVTGQFYVFDNNIDSDNFRMCIAEIVGEYLDNHLERYIFPILKIELKE